MEAGDFRVVTVNVGVADVVVVPRGEHSSFTVSNCCFNTVKSTVMPWSLHMRCWALRGRSEQLPTKYPNALNCLTKSRVIAPGGAPTSRVPSMSKLIKVVADTWVRPAGQGATEGQAGCHNEWLQVSPSGCSSERRNWGRAKPSSPS